MRYAIIQPAYGTVSACRSYTGADWSAFKAAYESDNPQDELIQLANESQFPFGQGWEQVGQDEYVPADGYPKSYTQLKACIARQVAAKTYYLQFTSPATFTYDGKQFSRAENARHWLLGMLANRNNTAYPCYFPASAPFGAQVEINDAAEMSAFIQPLYDESLTLQEAGNLQIAAVAALSNIADTVSYVDPR